MLTQRRNFSCVRSFSGTINSFSVLGRLFHFLSCWVIFNLINIWCPSSITVKFCHWYHVWCCILQWMQNKQKKVPVYGINVQIIFMCNTSGNHKFTPQPLIPFSLHVVCRIGCWLNSADRSNQLKSIPKQSSSQGLCHRWNWNWWVYQHLSCAAVNTTAWNVLVSPCSVTSILS